MVAFSTTKWYKFMPGGADSFTSIGGSTMVVPTGRSFLKIGMFQTKI